MHIEINNGGLAAAASINDFQDYLTDFISRSEDILSSFKTVQNTTYNLNGGVGSLREAVENIGQRITEERERINHAKETLKKTVEFTINTVNTDKHVAEIVNQNKEEFYKTNPWLKPPVPEEEKSWGERAWNSFKEGMKELGENIKEGFIAVRDTLKKGWDKLVEFYEEHKKIIQTVLIVVGAIAAIVAVVSGGGLLVLAPLLTAIGFSAPVAAAISGVVAVTAIVSTVASSTLNVVDVWFEIDNTLFNRIQTALNITAGISNALVSIGALYNSFHPGAIDQVKEQLANQPVDKISATQPDFTLTDNAPDAKFNDSVDIIKDPIKNDEFYVKGNYSDDFVDYWNNLEDYTTMPSNNNSVQWIDAGDVEGVYLHGNEVRDPSVFYKTRPAADYTKYASNGLNNNPLEVTKIIKDGKEFYLFAGEGRHRLIAAKEIGVKVPVIIRDIVIKK